MVSLKIPVYSASLSGSASPPGMALSPPLLAEDRQNQYIRKRGKVVQNEPLHVDQLDAASAGEVR